MDKQGLSRQDPVSIWGVCTASLSSAIHTFTKILLTYQSISRVSTTHDCLASACFSGAERNAPNHDNPVKVT